MKAEDFAAQLASKDMEIAGLQSALDAQSDAENVMTKEEAESICVSMLQWHPDSVASYIRYLITIYQKERRNSASLQARCNRLEGKLPSGLGT